MPLHDTANVLAKPQHDATAVARRKASLLKKQRQLRRELRACFGAVETEVVLRNVPPAVVYRCRRQPLDALHGLPGDAPAVDAGAPVMAARAAD